MEEQGLLLIPKVETYIEYMLNLLIKLPRTEKFSIGNEYKESMYKMLECIMYLNKVKSGNNHKNKENIDITQNQNLIYLNKIDTL